MGRRTPKAWAELMTKRGVRPTARGLAERLDVSVQTAVRLIYGEPSSQQVVDGAAELLKVSPNEIRALRGEQAQDTFSLPQSAHRLTSKQRAAVLAVVRAMLEPDDAPIDDVSREAQDRLQEDLRDEDAARKVDEGSNLRAVRDVGGSP